MAERYTNDTFELSLAVRIADFGEVAVRPFDARAIASAASVRPRTVRLSGRRIGWTPGLSPRLAAALLLIALLLALLAASLVANRPHLKPLEGSRAMVTTGVWSPDGSKLAFFTGGIVEGGAEDGQYRELYVIDGDGTDLRMLYRDHPAWSTVYGMQGPLEWSPDGRQLAFQVRTSPPWANDATGLEVSDIAVIGLDGGPPTIVTKDTPRGPLVGWSPTGDRLLFNVYRGDGGTDAYTIGADGNDLRLLTPDHLGLAVEWAPTDSVVLLDERSNPIPDVNTTDSSWLVRADGSQRTRVSPAGAMVTGWTPDGQRLILWRTTDTGGSVLSAGLDGSDVQVEEAVGEGGVWVWAHDGTRYATEGTNGGIFVSEPGGTPRYVTRAVGDRGPQWSPDDTLIAFLGTRPEGTGIFVVPADGGEPRLVAANATSLGWQPSTDGHRRLAFIRDGTVGTVDTTNDATRDLVPRGEISERDIAPSGDQGTQDRMIITADGPDRDVYHVPLASHLAFAFDNRTDQPWLVLIDEGWFYHPDCQELASAAIILASTRRTPVGGRTSSMLVEDCIVPPFATVGFDLPHDALGPLTIELVPQDSPGASNQKSTAKPYVVVFDFEPAAAPSLRPT